MDLRALGCVIIQLVGTGTSASNGLPGRDSGVVSFSASTRAFTADNMAYALKITTEGEQFAPGERAENQDTTLLPQG